MADDDDIVLIKVADNPFEALTEIRDRLVEQYLHYISNPTYHSGIELRQAINENLKLARHAFLVWVDQGVSERIIIKPENMKG